MTTNVAASIRAKLKQHATQAKEDFNLTLTRYGIERLLYRLSISKHASTFLLKGALLFQVWYGETHRPTRDADFLGFGPDDTEHLKAVFREVCEIKQEDGVVFDLASIRAETIREGANYGGVRLHLLASLDGARISVQVDVGFGDAVEPAPTEIEFPTLLDKLPAPRLRAYPKASVAAEKLHAIVVLGMGNSRMKDYFDLAYLLRDGEVRDDELVGALKATFARRATPIPAQIPIGLTDEFAMDRTKRGQWQAFLKKNDLGAPALEDVVGQIRERAREIGLPARE